MPNTNTDIEIPANTETVRCECGEVTGEQCSWTGPIAETVVVEYTPEYLRESHRTAGNMGRYPANGAIRLRMEKSCAHLIADTEGEWAEVKG